MNVRELIGELMKIKDQDREVFIHLSDDDNRTFTVETFCADDEVHLDPDTKGW